MKKFNTTPWEDYIAGAKIDLEAVPAFKSLASKITRRAQILLSSYEVEMVNKDPYKTSLEMRASLIKKQIKVFTWGADHPVFSREENNLLRMVHDIDWHGLSLSFSLEDEIKTHQKMVEALLLTKDESRALYTEIVWQVTAYYITWQYQEQKAIFIN